MIKTIILSMCLAASSLSLNARAQDENAAAALDKSVELEAVAKKVICGTECQNKARVARSEYRKVLGTEYIRELILK
jgi:hypothetical protein